MFYAATTDHTSLTAETPLNAVGYYNDTTKHNYSVPLETNFTFHIGNEIVENYFANFYRF